MAALSVFYGSQTGCAESIAQQIYSAAVEKQLDAQLLPLNEFQASKVADKPGHHVIIVCSTTGNGEPPDNAGKFWRYVKRRTQPKDMLANMSFTVLGLGDTNYDRFCYMGKSIDKRFAELGAQRYYALGVADEALGLEDFVEPWLEGLWAAFDKSSGASGETTSSSSDGEATSEGENVQVASESETTTQQHVDLTQHLPANLISYESMFGPLTAPTQAPEELPRLQASVLAVRFADEPIASGPESTDSQEIGPSHPFLASVVSARYLTSSASERKVLGVDLDLGESGITYKPGDSIGVKCPNRVEDVNVLLARLGLEGSKYAVIEMAASTGRVTRRQASGANRFPAPVTVRELFEQHVDILSSPKKAVLRALATYCSNDEERAQLLVLSSKAGADKYQAFVADQQLTFLELLLLFPSCNPPLDHVLSLLPQLMARYYSVASSPLLNPRQLTIAFTVVENAVGPRAVLRRGLCTNWMKDMVQPLLNAPLEASDIKFPIFPRPTEDFTLPASQEPPLLLIGPGTGVAPFIGFLQQRHHEVQNRVDDGSDASAPGDISLFFGCRRSTEDWIFRNEMESFVENGTLSKLVTAFSREQDEKHYVQHQLRANGDFVCELVLQSSGYVFVCGDGVAMARDVHAALVEILEEHGKMTKEDAEARLRELATSKRYIRDIW